MPGLGACWDASPFSSPSSEATSASSRCPFPVFFTRVHLILSEDDCGRQIRRPGISLPSKLVDPHRNVAAICRWAGYYAAISTSYLTHADGSARARAGASHPHNFQLSARPVSPSICGAGRLWVGGHVRECAEMEERVRIGSPVVSLGKLKLKLTLKLKW